MKIEGTVGSGFTPPVLEDDLYDAEIVDLCEPYEEADTYNPGKDRTRFWLDWQIGGTDDTLRQWMNIPLGMLGTPATLNPKAGVYSLMDALGLIGADGGFTFDLDTWIGMRARVMVENKPNKDGEIRPYITGVKPPKAARTPVPEKRTPVGLRQR